MLIATMASRNHQTEIMLTGSIYADETKEVQARLASLIEQGEKALLIDLSQLDYIDSAGLGMLISVQKLVVKKGGSFKIRGVKGLVKELFELTHLTKVFELQ